jgi:hypothetical protein
LTPNADTARTTTPTHGGAESRFSDKEITPLAPTRWAKELHLACRCRVEHSLLEAIETAESDNVRKLQDRGDCGDSDPEI